MTSSVFERVYSASPRWLQGSAIGAYGFFWRWARLGGSYEEVCRAYAAREKGPHVDWRALTEARLADVLEAARETPFYAERWTEEEKEAARHGQLSALPMLSKDDVRRYPDQLVRAGRRPLPQFTFHTSGSSGTPIKTMWTLQELRESMALREVRSANWAGVSFSMPRATFSGRVVQPDPDADEHLHRYNPAERQVYLSPYHLSRKNAPRYLQALRRHGSTWGTGYAVSWYLLASFALEDGLDAPTLKAIVTTSEKVTDKMRATITEAFRGKVYEEYSTVENVAFASECSDGSLHVSSDACVMEILRPDGTSAPAGEFGEVVATGLFRKHQPFIRFRLGDTAAWSSEKCSCGRQLPVIQEIGGRIEDTVVTPDGRSLVRFHGVFLDIPTVREGQVVQLAIDRIVIRLVPEPGFTDLDRNRLLARASQRLGSGVKVTVELVDRIERDARGKFRAVVSHLGSDGS